MRRVVFAALFVAAFGLTGCNLDGMDSIMGRNAEGTPVPAPQRIDCDLIFPGTDQR
jgi:hypothetical protein